MKKDVANFVAKYGHDMIWVVIDRLTKSTHFLSIKQNNSLEKLIKIYIDSIF